MAVIVIVIVIVLIPGLTVLSVSYGWITTRFLTVYYNGWNGLQEWCMGYCWLEQCDFMSGTWDLTWRSTGYQVSESVPLWLEHQVLSTLHPPPLPLSMFALCLCSVMYYLHNCIELCFASTSSAGLQYHLCSPPGGNSSLILLSSSVVGIFHPLVNVKNDSL